MEPDGHELSTRPTQADKSSKLTWGVTNTNHMLTELKSAENYQKDSVRADTNFHNKSAQFIAWKLQVSIWDGGPRCPPQVW